MNAQCEGADPQLNEGLNALNQEQNNLDIGNLTESTSNVLIINGGAGAVIGDGTTLQVRKSNSTTDGYLARGDWATFNGKQDALGFTPLQGSIADQQVAFGSGTNITGDPNLAWDGSVLNVGQNLIELGTDGTASFLQGAVTITNVGDGQVSAGQFNGEIAFLSSFMQLTPSDAPSPPAEGMMYKDSGDGHFYGYANGSWRQMDNP